MGGEGPVVVLGAGGYLGRALSGRLVGRRPLRLVSRRARPDRAPEGWREVELLETDLGVPDAVEQAVADAAAVLHLVHSPHPRLGWRGGDPVGRALMERVLSACPAQVPVVFASTVRTTRPASSGAYEEDKRAAERLLGEASAAGSVRGVTLRLPTVYGVDTTTHGSADPGRGVVATMTKRALASEELELWGRGDGRRNLVHVSDAARAFELALEHALPLAGRSWDVCGDETLTVGELFESIAGEVAQVTGRPAVGVRRVEEPDHATGGDAADVLVDPAPFRALTGWTPDIGWSAGLRETVRSIMHDESTSEE